MGRPIPYKGGGKGNWTTNSIPRYPTNQQDPSVIYSKAGLGNSLPSAAFTNAYGQKNSLLGQKSLPKPLEIKDIHQNIVTRYPAQEHKSFGYFNGGFPFLLTSSDYLDTPENQIFINGSEVNLPSRSKGITKQYNTGIYIENQNPTLGHLGGGFPVQKSTVSGSGFYVGGYDYDAKIVAVNNFFNLACIETDFVIKTTDAPAGYTTGYCYNSDDSSEDGLQYVTQDWEVVNSYDETAFPPSLRQYADPTGVTKSISIFSNGLMDPTGLNYSSIHFTGKDIGNDADFFVPITIQPDNTGAFVITLDEGVADYFENLADYSSKKAFNCNMMFDFQINQRDHEGFERSTIDYHIFPTKAYIVPAAGWDFEVLSSKVKGIYYEYGFREDARYAGDNASFLDRRMPEGIQPSVFSYSLKTASAHGSYDINYNQLGFTHVPFEVRANDGDSFYGSTYILESNSTFLKPVPGTSQQKFINGTNYYDTDGFGSSPKSFRAIARNISVLDDYVITSHYQTPQKHDLGGSMDHTSFPASVFTQTPYSVGANSNNSPFVSDAFPSDENPYKRRQAGNRHIEDTDIETSREIPRKIKDLTYPLPEFQKMGSVGGVQNIGAGKPFSGASLSRGLNLGSAEQRDDRLMRGFGNPTSRPKPVFRTAI